MLLQDVLLVIRPRDSWWCGHEPRRSPSTTVEDHTDMDKTDVDATTVLKKRGSERARHPSWSQERLWGIPVTVRIGPSQAALGHGRPSSRHVVDRSNTVLKKIRLGRRKDTFLAEEFQDPSHTFSHKTARLLLGKHTQLGACYGRSSAWFWDSMAVASDEWEDSILTFEHIRTQFERDKTTNFRESFAAAVAHHPSSTRVRALLKSSKQCKRGPCTRRRGAIVGNVQQRERTKRRSRFCTKLSAPFDGCAVHARAADVPLRWPSTIHTRRAVLVRLSHLVFACHRTVSTGQVNRLRRRINLSRLPMALRVYLTGSLLCILGS